MRFTSSYLLILLALALGLSQSAPAMADVLLKAQAISLPGVSLQHVTARIGPAQGDGHAVGTVSNEDKGNNVDQVSPSASDQSSAVHLHLQAERADVASMAWHHVGLTLDGTVQRDDQMRWILHGSMQVSGAPGAALSKAKISVVLSETTNTLQLNLSQGRAEAEAALPLDQPSHAQMTFTQVPAVWLRGLLSTVWSGRPTGGSIDGKLALDIHDSGVQSSGQFQLHGAGFDTPGGSLAGQRLDATGRFTLDSVDDPAQIDLDSTLQGGELLLGPLYAKLPAHAVELGLHAKLDAGAVSLSRLRVDDSDALHLAGALSFSAKGNLKALKITRMQATFPAAYQRYGKAWLTSMGLPALSIEGELKGSVELRDDGLRSFAFDTSGLEVGEESGSIAVDGLRGGLDWSRQGTRPATTLAWDRLRLYGIPNGAATSRWRSRAGALRLQQPLDVPVLKGQLKLSQLDWHPAAVKNERLQTSIVLTGVDMAQFSKLMGWPAFPGTLAGAIPSLRWVDNRFVLDGGLSAHLFDGFVDLTRMTLQRPFGAAPVLSADVSLRQLDLGAITSVFDFGSITGRLDGSIDDLRLVDWSPVAFKASLLADSGGRISQRAVNNLTSVGGGGVAGGLQGAVLKLFKTFSYSRIGLNCTLRGSVCQMSGLESDGDGYTIVQGRGLPHLEVIGHQHRVDWPTLVTRLEAAVNGPAPEVR